MSKCKNEECDRIAISHYVYKPEGAGIILAFGWDRGFEKLLATAVYDEKVIAHRNARLDWELNKLYDTFYERNDVLKDKISALNVSTAWLWILVTGMIGAKILAKFL